MNKQRGITLVALVITVIVLLIIAGITISLTLGEEGVIRRAQESGENYTNAAEYEKILLANLTDDMDGVINNGTTQVGGVQRKDFTLTIPYVGTSSATIKVDTDTIQSNISKYIYIIGEEIVKSTETEVTVENLPADSNLDITVIAVTDAKQHLISTSNIKTEAKTYLYNNGDQCESITGGWKADASRYDSDTVGVAPTLTFNEDNMQIHLKSSSKLQSGAVIINNNLDYSQYKKIYITYTATLECYSSSSVVRCYTVREKQKEPKNLCYQNAITTKTTKIFDISQIEDFYIYIQSHASDGAANCNIYEIWLEK